MGILTPMGKHLLPYIAVFFVSVSSLMLACPEVYGTPLYHPTASNGVMPDANPCRDADQRPPLSICYRVLQDRLFSPATISGPLGDPGASLTAADNSVLGVPSFSAQLPAWRSKSPPKLALTVLFLILRI